MFSRILAPALSLSVCLVSARADEKAIDVVVDEVSTGVVVTAEPVLVICTFGGAEVGEEDVAEPTTCEAIELKDGEGDVAVDGEVTVEGDVELDTEVRHYSGSEVERGDGQVDPSIVYMTGSGAAPETPAAAEVVLASSVAGSGIGAAAEVQGYVSGVSLVKADVRIIRSGGDVVISD